MEHEREREGKLRDIAASLTQPRVRRNIKARTSEPTRDVVDAVNQAHQDKLIRGDPDGCGLDLSGTRYSPTSELRVDLPAEDLLNIKKGWLMKQGLNKVIIIDGRSIINQCMKIKVYSTFSIFFFFSFFHYH